MERRKWIPFLGATVAALGLAVVVGVAGWSDTVALVLAAVVGSAIVSASVPYALAVHERGLRPWQNGQNGQGPKFNDAAAEVRLSSDLVAVVGQHTRASADVDVTVATSSLRLDCALHCDAASAREGLLHVLGGGITRVGRPQFPAPLGTALALRFILDEDEYDVEHSLDLRLVQDEGSEVFGLTGAFQIARRDEHPGEDVAAVIALPLSAVILPAAGFSTFEISIGDDRLGSVRFRAHPLEA